MKYRKKEKKCAFMVQELNERHELNH